MTASQIGQRVAIGTFLTRDEADAAVSDLQRAGFMDSEIGVLARPETNEADAADHADPFPADERAATGAFAGATAGAGLGGLWVAGIAAGIVPAIGPLVAGGFGSVLAGAAAGAAAGGVGGALLGLGTRDEDAQGDREEFISGSAVITVRAGHRYSDAVSILIDHGAVISSEAVTNCG